jgi:hypothetical protein
MRFAIHRHAALVLLPILAAACSSSPPAPVEAGHPAHANTAAAPPAALTTLQSYRDYGRPAPGPAVPADADTTEKRDAHEH